MDTAAIKARKSVRTFTDQPIAPETIAELERFIADDVNPFGVPVTFHILDREKYGLSSPVILGSETYIGAKCRRQEHAELAFGYSFEKLVLFATTLGLGTVWLAGTLDRKAKGYAREATGDIQKVDLGIALCHFEIAAQEAGLAGAFAESGPGIEAPERTEYVITYTLDGPSPLN